jgi:hypothetical protein
VSLDYVNFDYYAPTWRLIFGLSKFGFIWFKFRKPSNIDNISSSRTADAFYFSGFIQHCNYWFSHFFRFGFNQLLSGAGLIDELPSWAAIWASEVAFVGTEARNKDRSGTGDRHLYYLLSKQ